MLDFQLSHTVARQFQGLFSLYCGGPAPLVAALMSSYGFGGYLNSPQKISIQSETSQSVLNEIIYHLCYSIAV